MPSRLPTEERQAAIVGTAPTLAREHGPALITTGEIAAAVGVSQGALFKQCQSMDAIWLAAMAWVHRTLLATLQDAAWSPRAWTRRLRQRTSSAPCRAW